jgi:outer membrane lipoprotein-sorting protein
MKQQLIYCLLFFTAFSTSLFAQSDRQAEQIIANFIRSIEQNAVQADFEMTVFDDRNRVTQVQEGIFRMKGNKFSMITDDLHIFFDGKTYWTYMDAMGEVTIIEPTGAELADVNPILLLRQYQNNSTIRFASGNNSAENHNIEMTPNVSADFSKIFVQINKTNQNLSAINLTGNSFRVNVSFKNFRRGVNIPDSSFVFDKSKYDDDLFINDLR